MKNNSARVLDVCCGSRMFWFNKENPDAIYADKRIETHQLKDRSSKNGVRELIISPDLQADFTDLPFDDESFYVVVFDPPHLVKNGATGWLAKKYGKLFGDWREEISSGFKECFRVLKPSGTLIFKWNETDIPVSEIINLAGADPLIGNRCGKQNKSHWLVFIK